MRSQEQFLDLHGESVVLYDPTLGSLKGRPALDNMWKGLFSMFPDYRIRKVRSFGQEDWVCLGVEESGTMKGPIHEGPPGDSSNWQELQDPKLDHSENRTWSYWRGPYLF